MAEARIAVFCVADLSDQTLDNFFRKANEMTHRHDFDAPMGFLMLSDTVPEQVDQHTTRPPVDGTALEYNPFRSMTTIQVVAWAKVHLASSGLSMDNMVILDERSGRDETCVLVSLKDLPDEQMPEGFEKWKIVRADFESSLLPLMVKETGVGGDDHLETDYEGSDEVLRISVRDRLER